jgi:hypothetical protein
MLEKLRNGGLRGKAVGRFGIPGLVVPTSLHCMTETSRAGHWNSADGG